MEGAKKDSNNPHFRSSYADLASIWDACREPLTKNGLSILQVPSTRPGEVTVWTFLAHASGQYVQGELVLPVAQETAQGYGSAITYGRRYSLAAMTGVAPEDDDGNAASGRTWPVSGEEEKAATPSKRGAQVAAKMKPLVEPAEPSKNPHRVGYVRGRPISELSKEELAVAIDSAERRLHLYPGDELTARQLEALRADQQRREGGQAERAADAEGVWNPKSGRFEPAAGGQS
jgi:hypothetical protein